MAGRWCGLAMQYLPGMAAHRNRVTSSYENDERNRCVDLVLRADGLHGFEEWRRESEDPGNWSLMCHDGGVSYTSASAALAAACGRVAWLAALQPKQP